MRTLTDYLDLDKTALMGRLAIVELELMHAYDQIGFLKSEELTQKRDVWLNMPEESTQARDRAASYAAAAHSIELVKVEAERNVLLEERNFLLLLIEKA